MDDRFLTVCESFKTQANYCKKAGSPFYADFLVELSRVLRPDSNIGRVFSKWPGEPARDAVALRFVAALHYLAITKQDAALIELFPPDSNRASSTTKNELSLIIAKHENLILDYLKSPPQTNEVGRSMALLGGFLEAAKQFGPDLDVYEIGASAGLNMAFDQYYYQTDDWRWGNAGSAVQFTPNWQGRPPPLGLINVHHRTGCDVSPINAASQKNKLLSYIWPDQLERVNRIRAAIDYAISTNPIIDKMEATEWLKKQNGLASNGRPSVFYHSIIWQYFSEQQKQEFQDAIMEMGLAASNSSPLIWLRLEPAEDGQHAELRMTVWPNRQESLLAESGFHGEWIRWLGTS